MNENRPLKFHKYQGTGNDFVMIDNRDLHFPKEDTDLVKQLCDRRFGIGADGLILLENDAETDFKMVYFNADGNQSTMCGNGGRCLVAFAKALGVIKDQTTFMAIDGLHEARVTQDEVALGMKDVSTIKVAPHYYFMDTGSPHHVQEVTDLDNLDVQQEGAKIRYGLYGQKGSNINFVTQETEDTFNVRTYERGVEDETHSCGTGVTAVALAMHHAQKTKAESINIKTKGGHLKVQFSTAASAYNNIKLCGPAKKVFEGTWPI